MAVIVPKSARPRRAAGVAAWALVAGLLPATGPAQTEVAAPLLRLSGPPQPWGVWYQPGSLFNPGASSPIAFFGPGGFVPRPEILAQHWVVRTYDSPQAMGSEPWGGLQAFQVTGPGTLAPRDFAGLLGQAAGRPVVFVVQGNLIAYDAAVNGSLWVHDRLDGLGALPPTAVVVGFDLPGGRGFRLDPPHLTEKQRRAVRARLPPVPGGPGPPGRRPRPPLRGRARG